MVVSQVVGVLLHTLQTLAMVFWCRCLRSRALIFISNVYYLYAREVGSDVSFAFQYNLTHHCAMLLFIFCFFYVFLFLHYSFFLHFREASGAPFRLLYATLAILKHIMWSSILNCVACASVGATGMRPKNIAGVGIGHQSFCRVCKLTRLFVHICKTFQISYAQMWMLVWNGRYGLDID